MANVEIDGVNSIVYTDQVDPKTGTTLTLGTSGDTVNLGTSVTAGTGFGGDLSFGGDTFGANKVIGANDAYSFSLETSGNTALTIDANGHVTMPLQSLVIARNEATLSNVTGDGTAYTHLYATEIKDQNGDYASPTFTAPVAGSYLITASANFEDISSATYVVAYINASNRSWYFLSSSDGVKNAGNDFRISGTALIDMDASDTASITVQVSGVGGDTVDFVADDWFTIQIVA